MTYFVTNIVFHPMGLVTLACVFIALFGFFAYIRGFSNTIKNVFTLEGDEHEVKHGYVHAVQGMLMLTVALGVWEFARVLRAAVLGNPLPSGAWMAWLFLAVAAVWAAKTFLFPKKGGGGGGGH